MSGFKTSTKSDLFWFGVEKHSTPVDSSDRISTLYTGDLKVLSVAPRGYFMKGLKFQIEFYKAVLKRRGAVALNSNPFISMSVNNRKVLFVVQVGKQVFTMKQKEF